MGQKYLMVTNTVIDFFGNKLPVQATMFLESITPIISVITQIEVLGWYNSTPEDILALTDYLNEFNILSLDEATIFKTIEIRQNYRIKTPDAIVAATALVHGLTLISRNRSDFKNITGINLMDSHNLTIG